MKDIQPTLAQTAYDLLANNKGLLAMDESTPTCDKRFAALGIDQTPEARCDYRTMIVTTPGLDNYISGAILYDETVRQHTSKGKSFIDILDHKGIIPGIKVDMGLASFPGHPGEKITKGLDGLSGRLKEYAAMGLRFAKWRAVFTIGKDMPGDEVIKENIDHLTRYALLCQQAGLVPLAEPEVLMDGTHTLEQCAETTTKVLTALFAELKNQKVDIKNMLLKTNMVLPGKNAPKQNSTAEIAAATLKCLLGCVPAEVPGIVFLSGGQASIDATQRLNEMHKPGMPATPWVLSFSFSRALQYPSIEIWKGDKANTEAAQAALLHRAKCNGAALTGTYTTAMEKGAA